MLVPVRTIDEARAAEAQGAEGIVLHAPLDDVRAATSLPVLWGEEGSLDGAHRAEADACLLAVEHYGDDGDALARLHAEAEQLGLECVIDVRHEGELELALERLDPEIFLLSERGSDETDDPIGHVLDLLPDVPAGKLAIAQVAIDSREQVVALERAGIDAVIVPPGDVAALVGGSPPEV